MGAGQAPAGQGQSKESAPSAPTTKLEGFAAKKGVVIIRGYSEMGRVTGLGTVFVDAWDRDAVNLQTRVTGLSIRVVESGSYTKENSSFIDYDEIDSLLQGIDYISRANKDVTKMKNFEAEFKTKGDLSAGTFSDRGNISATRYKLWMRCVLLG
jgi:hypothetical protein